MAGPRLPACGTGTLLFHLIFISCPSCSVSARGDGDGEPLRHRAGWHPASVEGTRGAVPAAHSPVLTPQEAPDEVRGTGGVHAAPATKHTLGDHGGPSVPPLPHELPFPPTQQLLQNCAEVTTAPHCGASMVGLEGRQQAAPLEVNQPRCPDREPASSSWSLRARRPGSLSLHGGHMGPHAPAPSLFGSRPVGSPFPRCAVQLRLPRTGAPC